MNPQTIYTPVIRIFSERYVKFAFLEVYFVDSWVMKLCRWIVWCFVCMCVWVGVWCLLVWLFDLYLCFFLIFVRQHTHIKITLKRTPLPSPKIIRSPQKILPLPPPRDKCQCHWSTCKMSPQNLPAFLWCESWPVLPESPKNERTLGFGISTLTFSALWQSSSNTWKYTLPSSSVEKQERKAKDLW